MASEVKFDFNNIYLFIFGIVILGILGFYYYQFINIKREIEFIKKRLESNELNINQHQTIPSNIPTNLKNDSIDISKGETKAHQTKI